MQTLIVSSSTSKPRFHPFQNSHYHSFSSSPLRLTIDGFSCPSFSLFQTVRKSSPFLISNPKISSFRVFAASVPEAQSDEPTQSSGLVQSLQLGFMFATWYLLNIYFNIYNKQVLKVYPFPATVTAFQFGFASLVINVIWTLNLHPRPNISKSKLVAILPLALAHTLGNMLTNISLGKVSVSFTHTIKAMEPFFTVILSSLLLGEASQGLNVRELCIRSVLAAFCFHAYQQVSYGILEKVSPVTHSVGNCVKRVVVIVSSVIFFQTPVSPINALGTAFALVGVFLYSRAKRIKPMPKTNTA
ncbi:hypothetical protein TSUD_298600 [Trifolium subterraneum]|nr:hypothetical protein TSUD_298600 [Trifolium subterraneum]